MDSEARRLQEEIDKLNKEIGEMDKKDSPTYNVDKTNEITLKKDYIDEDPVNPKIDPKIAEKSIASLTNSSHQLPPKSISPLSHRRNPC